MLEHDRVSFASPLKPRDYLILLALAGGERHGYGLVKDIEQMTDDAVRMDPANLHRALQRLVREGLVSDLGRSEVDGRKRRRYALASEGRIRARVEAARLDKLSAIARARDLLTDPEHSS